MMELTLTQTSKILGKKKQFISSLCNRGKLKREFKDGQIFINSRYIYRYIHDRMESLDTERDHIIEAKRKLDKYLLTLHL